MKNICSRSVFIVITLSFLSLTSCNKNEDVNLIAPQYKTWNIFSGGDIEIPVLSNNWSIEYVQDISSGEKMFDKNGNLLTLEGRGANEAANEWLTLLCDKENTFTVKLEENLEKNSERKFLICIHSDGLRNYITFSQKAGTEYELVKTTFTEIEEEHQIYESKKGCSTLTLSNNTPEAVWKPTGYIFEDVVELSHFESDSNGAFDWIPEEGININMPELIMDNCIRWGNLCPYKEGDTTSPIVKDILNERKILMEPYTTLYLGGSITYCKRAFNYTFTIRNIQSGNLFDVTGTWRQIIVLVNSTIVSGKPI